MGKLRTLVMIVGAVIWWRLGPDDDEIVRLAADRLRRLT